MAVRYRHQIWEDYMGAWYTFEHAGDAIPAHSHVADLGHNVCVVRGAVRVNERIVRAGENYIFDSTLPHEIVALIDDTLTLHVYDVFQTEYLKLPPECLTGVINGPPA